MAVTNLGGSLMRTCGFAVLLLILVTGIASAQAPTEQAGPRTDGYAGFSYLFRNYQRGFVSGGMPGWQAGGARR